MAAHFRKSGVYLRVLYDYDYQGHDGQPVSIKSAEECLLLKKTTPEWWYVIKHGEKKPIYVPSNYMEEIHKTVIRVDGGGDGKPAADRKAAPPRTAPKPTRQAPTPQKAKTTNVASAKKKGPPPKPPAKPVVRKASDEEEVLKQLDNILEHAFDHFPDLDEDPSSDEPSSGTNSKSNSLQRGVSPIPVSSGSNSRTGSLQRDTKTDSLSKSEHSGDRTSAELNQRHSKKTDSQIEDRGEPVPDYDEDDDEGNHSHSSPVAGRHDALAASPGNRELMGDSGISEGSTECLDNAHTGGSASADNSLDRKRRSHDRKSQEEPNYENISTVFCTDQNEGDPMTTSDAEVDDGPDYANIASIQAHIHGSGRETSGTPQKRQSTASTTSLHHRRRELKVNSFGTPIILDEIGHSDSEALGSPASISSFFPMLAGKGSAVAVGDESAETAGDRNSTGSLPGETIVALPVGWQSEKNAKGETVYVKESDSSTWRRSTQTTGKVYFFNNSGDTVCDLNERSAPSAPSKARLTRYQYEDIQVLSTPKKPLLRPQRPVSSVSPPMVPSVMTASSPDPLGVQTRSHGHPARSQYRASWAPGDREGISGSLRAAGMVIAAPGMVSPPSRTSQEMPPAGDGAHEDETQDTLHRLEKLDRSQFSNPRTFLRQTSLPAGNLEERLNEISSPNPALMRFYTTHAYRKMSAPDLTEYSTLLRQRTRRDGSISDQLQEKQGYLRVTKVLDTGRKSKKNWSQQYVFVRGGVVFIYKDQKATIPKPNSPDGKPESQFDLAGANLDYGKKDISSKKNVIQLTTKSESQFLFQLDDATKMNEWYAVFSENIQQMGAPLGTSTPDLHLTLPDPTQQGQETATTPDGAGGKGGSKKFSAKSGSLERAATPTTPTDEAEKTKNVRHFLYKWLYSRPSVDSLRKKGIYKDAVFGSHLHRVCDRDGLNIPVFVTTAITAIEKRGLTTDGIYRISGNMAQIQKLRLLVDSGSAYDFDSSEWEIHVLTGTLKLFFREMTDPLVPFTYYDKFVLANQSAKESKKKVFRDIIKTLPPSNRETLKVLSFHLNKVTTHSAQNRMQVQNLAIVWGPTLMRPPDTEAGSASLPIAMVQAGQVVEYILQHCQTLF